MDAVEGLRIFIEVAASAYVCIGKGKFPNASEISLRVLGGRKTKMAIEAAQFSVHRRIERRRIDFEQGGLAIFHHHGYIMIVTSETVLFFTDNRTASGDGGSRMGIMAVSADRSTALL